MAQHLLEWLSGNCIAIPAPTGATALVYPIGYAVALVDSVATLLPTAVQYKKGHHEAPLEIPYRSSVIKPLLFSQQRDG
ncbi:hypothetical protein GCM10022212_32190 [Actimicrobium antarcticum]|uniref:Uncharacterized protein n=1 Tax=Actimicrobium antarcticum TaxID=1051899 RepID=A0ABP7TTZ3_9BURK